MNSSDESNAKQRRTVVEQGTQFRGSLSSTCPIDVHGRIEGEIETPALSVSATGSVHGRAKVGSVSSEGELSGEFEAEHVEISGRVRDNTVIRARSLNVKLGAERGKLQVIFGECELAIGDEPAERSTVNQAADPGMMVSEAQGSEAPLMDLERPQPKQKNGHAELAATSWSQPPSQPPPAS